MFQSLTGSLSSLVKNLQGRAHLNRENIQESMQEIRNTLLEADAGYDFSKSNEDVVSGIKEFAFDSADLAAAMLGGPGIS